MELIFEYPFLFIIVRNFFLNIWRYKRQINFLLSLIPNPQLVAVIRQELFYLLTSICPVCPRSLLPVIPDHCSVTFTLILWRCDGDSHIFTQNSTACNCKYWTSVHVLKNFVHVLYTKSSLPILVNNL